MLRLWKVTDGSGLEYQANIVAHDDGVTGMALSPDDRLIATVSSDAYLKTWRMDGMGLQNRIRVGDRVLSVAFSPDGRMLATGDADGRIKLWNVLTGAPVPFSGSHEHGVYALAWTPDSKILVSGGADKMLRYWNVASGQRLANIAAHDGAVRAVVVVP
jgi:WD40 repeat protein